jgi:hypothetical protein
MAGLVILNEVKDPERAISGRWIFRFVQKWQVEGMIK